MEITQFEQELKIYFGKLLKDRNQPIEFEILFNLYTQTEAGDILDFGETQDSLIELSAYLPAQTMEDILFKMALWRRHAAQIDPFDQDMTGDERLGYSVFRDLAMICQRDEVFTERDRQYSSIDSDALLGRNGTVFNQ